MLLEGKTAIVTGSSKGLGRAFAMGLAEAGAQVIVNGTVADDISRVVKEIKEKGGEAAGCTESVGTMAGAQRIIQSALDEFGRLDILVNNAGIIRRAPAIEHSEQYWDEVMQVNLKAIFFLSQAAAKIMAEQGSGKIIHIASMLSYHGGILVPSYTAAKSGLAGITRAMANEWAAQGINVNAIAPGYMATDNTAPLQADPVRNKAILARIPAGRWGDPGDLKGAVVFLASAAADYMHGAIVPVDGAWLAR